MIKKYEFVFLTRPDLKGKKQKEIFSALEQEIKKAGGKINKREKWGEKNLVYPINKETRASFWVWQLSFEKVVKFSSFYTFINREDEVIRYLLLREGKRR